MSFVVLSQMIDILLQITPSQDQSRPWIRDMALKHTLKLHSITSWVGSRLYKCYISDIYSTQQSTYTNPRATRHCKLYIFGLVND